MNHGFYCRKTVVSMILWHIDYHYNHSFTTNTAVLILVGIFDLVLVFILRWKYLIFIVTF